MPNESLTVFTL